MKSNVTFTAMFLTICFGGLAAFGLLRTQYAAPDDCTPVAFNNKEEYQGCPSLKKKATWSVVFPDAQYVVYPEGTGQCASGHPCCDATLRTTECWPAFNQPIATDRKWSVLVTNKIAQTTNQICSFGCPNEIKVSCVSNGSTTFKVEHTCGGGDDSGCDFNLEFDGGGSNICECHPDSPDCVSPVLIDVTGNGFQLSNAAAGVDFDIKAIGTTQRISWTTQSSDDAWLVLDRDGNGTIDDGSELFGNFTPQPNPPVGQERNGFLALAEYDKETNGGNGDGLITPIDNIFAALRLWQDRNHNGISEVAELSSLQAVGLKTIEVGYKEAKKEDEYGNYFRYRAKVTAEQGTQVSRWAWDVFLVAAK
jgi:hypothetical protein